MQTKCFGFLSSNALKIIAALTMLVDHIGYFFFPDIKLFRIIGRISYPIFAYMIANGCKYTKNKTRYFLTIFTMAVIGQIFFFLFFRKLDMGILVTFSIAIILVYEFLYLKKQILTNTNFFYKFYGVVLFFASVYMVFVINKNVYTDYGFWGSMLPVMACVFDDTKKAPFEKKRCLAKTYNILLFSVGLIILSKSISSIQYYCLFSVPVILCYNAEKGKYNMKYFFYVFYPLHLAVLEIISMMIN